MGEVGERGEWKRKRYKNERRGKEQIKKQKVFNLPAVPTCKSLRRSPNKRPNEGSIPLVDS